MKKSQTGVALPAIRTQKKIGSNSTYNKQRLRSVFVERVKQEIGQEEEYDAMASSQLGEEQRKLKSLLREFNDQSQYILSSFIEAQPRVTKTKSFRDSSLDLKVREKQSLNKDKIIEQCEVELKQLQSRCENLKYMSREEMEKQIQHINQEMESIRVENKELARGVTLNGLTFCKGERFHQIKELEYDKLQFDNKKAQLVQNMDEVTKENQALKQNTANTEKAMLDADLDYKEALASEANLTNLDKMKQVYKQKKKTIEVVKQKAEQLNVSFKQRYLNKLRQLDQANSLCKKTNEELAKKQEAVDRTRRELIILQHQLSALKQGHTTIQLLASQRK